MEKFSDIFKELKDRTTHPLIASFLVSWSILNWRFIFGLITLTRKDLEIKGHSDYLAFIEYQLQPWRSLLWPVIFSITYVLIWPLIRNLVLRYISFIDYWGKEIRRKDAGVRSVPMMLFFELQKEYEWITCGLKLTI